MQEHTLITYAIINEQSALRDLMSVRTVPLDTNSITQSENRYGNRRGFLLSLGGFPSSVIPLYNNRKKDKFFGVVGAKKTIG